MGEFSIWHWLVVLVIVLVLFGTKNLRTIGSDLGGAIRNFKRAMKDTDGLNTLHDSSVNAVPNTAEKKDKFDI